MSVSVLAAAVIPQAQFVCSPASHPDASAATHHLLLDQVQPAVR